MCVIRLVQALLCLRRCCRSLPMAMCMHGDAQALRCVNAYKCVDILPKLLKE